MNERILYKEKKIPLMAKTTNGKLYNLTQGFIAMA